MTRRKPISNEAIGALVRARRQDRGLGQPELGKILGVSGMAVQHYEIGRTPLTVERLDRIAIALRCELQDLIP